VLLWLLDSCLTLMFISRTNHSLYSCLSDYLCMWMWWYTVTAVERTSVVLLMQILLWTVMLPYSLLLARLHIV